MLSEFNILTIIIFVLILSFLIFVHELGHFITAKKAGIVVEEFGIGFPPRLLKVWQDLGKISLNGHEYLISRRVDMPRNLEVGSSVYVETRTRADGRSEVSNIQVVAQNNEDSAAETADQSKTTMTVTALEKPTEYSLNWIPFGGYVKMLGEEDPSAPGSFASKNKKSRFTVLAAGAGMNLITAVLTFTIMFMSGTPEAIGRAYIVQVVPDSPAEQAGILPNDVVEQIDETKIQSSRELAEYIRSHTGQEITLYLLREEEPLTVKLVPRVDPPPEQGAIGVMIDTQITDSRFTRLPFGQSLLMGFNATAGMIIQTFILPIEVFQNVVPAEQARPVGPVAIFNLTDSAVDASVETGQLYPILLLTAILSTALAITNLLPLPALDGGRILFIIIEAIRGKRVSPEKEGAIHFIGLALLLTLMVLISYNDVVNPIEIPDWPGLFR